MFDIPSSAETGLQNIAKTVGLTIPVIIVKLVAGADEMAPWTSGLILVLVIWVSNGVSLRWLRGFTEAEQRVVPIAVARSTGTVMGNSESATPDMNVRMTRKVRQYFKSWPETFKRWEWQGWCVYIRLNDLRRCSFQDASSQCSASHLVHLDWPASHLIEQLNSNGGLRIVNPQGCRAIYYWGKSWTQGVIAKYSLMRVSASWGRVGKDVWVQGMSASTKLHKWW